MNPTRSSRRQASCEHCGSDLITVSLQEGAIQFSSCGSCEVTVWERGGSVVSRSAVIADIPRR